MHNNPPNPLRDTAVVLPVIDGDINHDINTSNENNTQSTSLDL
jgi:hypothetical protein